MFYNQLKHENEGNKNDCKNYKDIYEESVVNSDKDKKIIDMLSTLINSLYLYSQSLISN